MEPGSPWKNAYSETSMSRFGKELLKREVFPNLLEVNLLVKEYRNHHNHEQPHSALGDRTPAEFADLCGSSGVYADLT